MTENQRPKRSTCLYAATLCLFLVSSVANAETKLPFRIPLQLGTGKVLEFPVDIARHRVYEVYLVFGFNDQEQRVTAKKLAGEPAVIPSFRITVRHEETVILSEEITLVGTRAFSETGFCRSILKFPLKPGRYNVKVEVTSTPMELTNYDALIEFTTDARTSDLEN